jgi:hypothetical protein
MKENVRRVYTAPTIERIPVEPGMVMASSITTGSTGAESSEGGNTFTRNPYRGSATPREIDEVITDILTIGRQ